MRLACIELVVLTGALLVTAHGPVPPRLQHISEPDRTSLDRLLERCHSIRDEAWSRAGTETLLTREATIAARLQTSADVPLDSGLLPLLGSVLHVCADEVDARGDIVIVAGFTEYGGTAHHFRALRRRLAELAAPLAPERPAGPA